MHTPSNPRDELLRRRLSGLGRAEPDQAIQPLPRTEPLPLSFGQRGLWLLEQIRPGSTEYLTSIRLRLPAGLDVDSLRQALDAVIARHEVLRTRYLSMDGEPRQVVDEPGPAPFHLVDLAVFSRTVAERRLTELTDRETSRPIDLAAEWPIRAMLAQLPGPDYVLLLNLHHIASDGWSEAILLSELDALYTGLSGGRQAELAPLPVQYADFAGWQRTQLSNTALTARLDHWRTKLAGLTPLELPTDRPRAAVRDDAGAVEPVDIPAELAERLIKLGRQHGATPYMVFLTAFTVLMGRYAGQTDVVVGSPVAGRDHPMLQQLIGMFVNMIVLRTDLAGEPTFLDVLARVRDTVLEAFTHQDTPFDRLVEELGGVRDPSRTPLFQVVFQLDNGGEADLPGLASERLAVGSQIARFDLDLTLGIRPDGSMAGQLEYATALFDADTARRMVTHYLRLLAGIAAGPDRPVGQLELLTPAERTELLHWANSEPAAIPVERSLAEAFQWQAAQTPDAVAVSCRDDRLTYAELNVRANRLAHRLRDQGVGAGDLVGICLDRSIDLIIGILGVLKAGAGYLPLDPGQPAERLSFIRQDAGVRLVISQSGLAGWLAGGEPAAMLLDQTDRNLPDTDPAPLAGPQDVAYVIYTSGSTGRPKGVPVSNGNVLRLLRGCAEDFGFGPEDVWTMFHSYAFDFSVWEMWGALLYGGRLVVVPFEVSRSPWEFLQLLVAEKVTMLNQTPSAFRRLSEAVAEVELAPETLRLRHVVFGGEALDTADLEPWFARFGDQQPVLVNMYGITETTVHVTYRPLGATDARRGRRSPIGRPLHDLRTYLLDDQLNLVPVGVAGQLYVSGAGVAGGYLGRPDLTADRFGPDPFAAEPGARMYRTGDLARWLPDGDLEFLGRADEQVKIRGHRIEPGEIEACMVGHPAVTGSVVMAHQPADSSDKQLVAYLVAATGHRLNLADIRDHLRTQLPAYMVPSLFVPLDELPVTANGKVDRKALPAPDAQRLGRQREHVPPRDAMEADIAGIWSKALGVADIGVHDNFFLLGGDSIRAIQAVGALRGKGVNLSVQDLMLHQTVEALARHATASTPDAASEQDEHRVQPFELISEADRAALPADVVDAYPMAMGQAGMVYEMLADRNVSLYHNITLFPMADDRPFSLPALEQATRLLVQRHEILRTSFDLTGYRQPLQLVHRDAPIEVGYVDLRPVPEADAPAILDAFVAEVRSNPLDVTQPPLVRFHVHQTAERKWTFAFIECHAVLDGWSHHSLLNELLEHYRAFRDGRRPQLAAARSVRYADYIALERRSLESAEDRQFWADRLTRYDRIELPPGWAEAPEASGLPYRVSVPFADLEPRLRRLAAAAEVPLKTVLFTAHLKVLSVIGGSLRFYSGLVHNGRLETAGGELARGMHLNPLPMCVDLTGATWVELTRQVFAEEVAVWPHRRFPLAEMQQAWGGSTTLVDVAFAYLDFHVFDTRQVEMSKIVDVSPNGFGLDVWTFPGVLHIAALPDRISRANGRRLAEMYRRVLVAMADDPSGDARGSLLAQEETEQLRSFASGPVTEPAQYLCVHELFEQQVGRTPDAVALRCADGRTVSYADLNGEANRLARHLRKRGIGPETVVGVLLRRGPGLITALLATLKAGAAYLPLDPGNPPQRLATVLREAAVGTVLTDSALADRVAGGDWQPVLIDREPSIAAQSSANLGSIATPEMLAYVIYTSGSTGTPKGVLIEHRNLLNYLDWRTELNRSGPGSGAPLYSAMAFDLPVTSLYPALLSGEPVTLTEDTGTPGIEALVSTLQPGGYRLLKLTPSHLAVLNHVLPAEAFRRAAGRLVIGGEELTADMLVNWRQHAPDTVIENEYGPTEATVGCSVQLGTASELPTGTMPIGRPVANTVLRVLDENGQLVPVGVLGELYIGGAQLARGYCRKPELTADRFVPDPFSSRPGERLYRTGDLVRHRPDGVLEFAGRVDDQVKIRGYRVELGEVEAALRRHLPVQDVAVRVRQTTRSDKELIGYLVPLPGAELDESGLSTRLAEVLPEYLIPAAWVVLDALPTTPSGKTDVAALPEPATATSAATLAPRTAVEKIIATVLAKALGREQVGVDTPFSDLGLHSLLIIRVLVELRDEHGLPIELRHFYEHRTMMDLATAVDPAIVGGFPPTAAAEMESEAPWASNALLWLRRTGSKPPLFCMYPGGGLWYVRLAEALPMERPLAALEWPGLHRDAPPPQSITSIARLFVDQIRRVQPTGPYHLFGWCGGGLVTGEMGRILHREGEQLTLVLLDPAQDAYTRGNMWEETGMFLRGEELLEQLNRATDPNEIAEVQRQFAEVLDYIIDEGTKEAPIPGDSFWPRRIRVWRELTQAMLGHRQRPYPGRMHLLVGDELAQGLHEANYGQTYAQYQDRWIKLAPNGLKIHRVGGDHLGVLRPPHVANLARLLTSLMERTEQGTG
jgi:amino acid adenylation domain-containing protein